MGTGRRRGPFERDTVVLAVVVIPPFTNTGCGEPPNKDGVLLGKLLLVKLEMDDEAETVPLELRRTALTVGKSSDRVSYSPRSREGRRELRKGGGVLAEHLGSGLPIVEGEPDRNLLLESDVANKDGTVKSRRPGSRERQRLDIDIGVRVGGIGERGRVIGIDDRGHTVDGKGGWASGRMRE